MKNVRGSEDNVALLVFTDFRRVIAIFPITVIQSSLRIPVHGHAVWHERIERYNLATGVTDNLSIGVAGEKQVVHHGFSEYETRHFRIRLIMQDPP